MITQINEKIYKNIINSIKKLTGYSKRVAIASFAEDLNLSINKLTKVFDICWRYAKKCLKEFKLNKEIKPVIETRGRKSVKEKYPHLENDVKKIMNEFSQIDPKFKSENMYVRITEKEIRKLLIESKKYTEETLPKKSALTAYINSLGYKLKKVRKTKPLKKIKETDAIFDNIKKVKEENINCNNTIMISLDAKDRVKLGEYSRNGYSRIKTESLDHDFSKDYLTPFGILDLKSNKVNFYNTKSKVTADYIVDMIETFLIESNYINTKKKLVIFMDNGPENSSKRTRFIYRIVELSNKYNIEIELAYYPPYHSKYNMVERVWARLENIWKGCILNNVETCIKYMKNLTWKDVKSNTYFIKEEYKTGIKETKEVMNEIEKQIKRVEGIEKWGLIIIPK